MVLKIVATTKVLTIIYGDNSNDIFLFIDGRHVVARFFIQWMPAENGRGQSPSLVRRIAPLIVKWTS